VTGWGQDVCAGWPAATATSDTSSGRLALLEGALLAEHVEVTADRSGRQTQTRCDSPCGERAMLGDRLPDPVPRAGIENVRSGVGPVRTVRNMSVSDKHNNSVT